MLCTLGDLVQDIVVWLGRDPEKGTDTPAQITRRRGGSAANVASLAATAGGAARFVGQVGDDPLADQLIGELTAAGVDVAVTRRGSTGSVVVLVDAAGERTMLSDRGAATQLAGVDEAVLDGVGVLHVPCYTFAEEPLATTAYELVGEALSRNIAVTVDASSVSVLRDFGIEEFLSLVSTIKPHVLFCNLDEATLLGVATTGAAGARLTVVKCGPGPARLIWPDGTTRSVPALPVPDVRDATGAGDGFAAGYLLARLDRRGHEESARAGHELASRVLRHAGASVGAAL